MSHHARKHRLGFTLVEVTMTIMVLGIVAASVVPIVFGASDAYATAAGVRRTSEKAAYAMERTIRLLRDAPEGATQGTLDITTATASQIRYADGRGLELTGATLYERAADGSTSPLCDQVSAFVLEYLASDGRTSTLAAPAGTQRFNITIVCNGFELRSAALARVRVMDP